ncbi:MAG: hypothetical protein IKI11_09690 [Neisseriaceae bacterium]|nr:hypothetical protein [Neisseriaceae bacterium]
MVIIYYIKYKCKLFSSCLGESVFRLPENYFCIAVVSLFATRIIVFADYSKDCHAVLTTRLAMTRTAVGWAFLPTIAP